MESGNSLAIICAILIVAIEAIDLFSASYVIKRLGTAESEFWRLDIWCNRWFKSWWAWRIGAWTLLASAVGWWDLSAAGTLAVLMVGTMAFRNVRRAWRVSQNGAPNKT